MMKSFRQRFRSRSTSFTSLPVRQANAQSVLARAWRGHVARKTLSLERAKLLKVKREAAMLQRKRDEARKLSAARRSQAPVARKGRVFGESLKALATSLPESLHQLKNRSSKDARDQAFSDISPVRPISSGADSSYSYGRLPTSETERQLTKFQQDEIQRVRAEYENSRAATPSHQHEIFTQVSLFTGPEC